MVTASIEAYYKVETNYPPRATRFFLFPFVSFPFLHARVSPFSLFLSSFPSIAAISVSVALGFAPLCSLFHPLSALNLLSLSLPLFPSGCVFFNFPVFQFSRLHRPNLFYACTLSSYSTSVRYVFLCFLSTTFPFMKKQKENVFADLTRVKSYKRFCYLAE